MIETGKLILMVAVFILFLPVFVLAGTVDLPGTGQTTCYSGNDCLEYDSKYMDGNLVQTTCYRYGSAEKVIGCAGTGQDGDIRAGVAWPDPRFTVNGDCVTDNLTGLMWVRSPDSVKRTWLQALDYANGLSLCGYTDWRLPKRNELYSLTDFSRATLALPSGHPFLNVQSGDYWSSTSYAYYPAYAWIVKMWNGKLYTYDKFSREGGYVWPVRSGQLTHKKMLPK